MAKKDVPGLEPRGFRWVITGRLAVSERIGGSGFQHRRVRREEEIRWLGERGINTILSFLASGQNRSALRRGGFSGSSTTPWMGCRRKSDEIDAHLRSDGRCSRRPRSMCPGAHRDTIDETMSGLLAGYLVHSGLVDDPIVATSLIQEILGRPLGPEGRRLIPSG